MQSASSAIITMITGGSAFTQKSISRSLITARERIRSSAAPVVNVPMTRSTSAIVSSIEPGHT